MSIVRSSKTSKFYKISNIKYQIILSSLASTPSQLPYNISPLACVSVYLISPHCWVCCALCSSALIPWGLYVVPVLDIISSLAFTSNPTHGWTLPLFSSLAGSSRHLIPTIDGNIMTPEETHKLKI